jgi:hypothetical protein
LGEDFGAGVGPPDRWYNVAATELTLRLDQEGKQRADE